jgi:predicted nuclease with TOPRIM domain
MGNLREISKANYTSHDGATRGAIIVGSLQRIADAMEKQAEATNTIAANWQRLTDERDMYKRWYQEKSAKIDKLNRRISALRGVNTRLKNKVKIID